MKRTKAKIKFFILSALFILGIAGNVSAQYGVGDYGSTSSGNYNTISTWSTWNGTIWIPAVAIPTFANSVFILSGRIVVLPLTGPYACNNLTVEAGGKLWAGNSATNIYISVYGNSIICDGQIGDGTNYDGIGFNIEGVACSITGTGQFDASRLRKNVTFNTTTSLTIDRNINLRFNSVTTTQIYNNIGGTNFNVTINAGSTVTLFPNGPNTGNVCIDGVNGFVNSSGTNIDAGGVFTINGTLVIPGVLYLATNNTTNLYTCQWIINGLVQAGSIIARSSGLAFHSLTINAGGKLELTGTPAWDTLQTTNNTYTFANNSTVEYSASGNQVVRVASEFSVAAGVNQRYGHLILSGSGNKSTTFTNLFVKNNLTITGSAVLDPNPFSSDIYVGGDWINYNATGFAEKNTIVRFNGSAAGVPQNITCPGGETFYNLWHSNTGNTFVRFNHPITAIYQLRFASGFPGYVDLNGNSLTILNPSIAGIQGANFTHYILSEQVNNSGKIIWNVGTGATGASTGFTFPFGIPPGGAANYFPVYIKNSSGSDLGTYTISTYGTPPNNLPWPSTPTSVTNLWSDIAIHNVPDNRHWTVDRFWQIESTVQAPADSVIISYRALELPDSDNVSTNMRAQFWNDTIDYWNRLQYGIPSGNSVIIPGFVPNNTAWTLSSVTSPLPIELLSFNAKAKTNTVHLKWETASEINNDYFTLEKSMDGEHFYKIGKVQGAGNSTQTLTYDFEDTKPLLGVSYYRLKQTDYDGQHSYSEMVPVYFRSRNFISSAFPNPASDKVYINTDPEMEYRITISNMEGKNVKNLQVNEGLNLFMIDVSDLAGGIYFIELKSTVDTQFIKLMKK